MFSVLPFGVLLSFYAFSEEIVMAHFTKGMACDKIKVKILF